METTFPRCSELSCITNSKAFECYAMLIIQLMIPTGTAPGDSNVMMNSSLFSHFMSGAGYPIGGASQIAQNIIPVIERAGGRVLVRARG